MTTPDPDEMIRFDQVAHDGAQLAIAMPRWAVERVERGEGVAFYGGNADGPDWRPLEDADGNVIGRDYT